MMELEPCPFCGRKMKLISLKDFDFGIQLIGHDDSAQIICPLMRGIMWRGTPEEAAEVWNRRVDNG